MKFDISKNLIHTINLLYLRLLCHLHVSFIWPDDMVRRNVSGGDITIHFERGLKCNSNPSNSWPFGLQATNVLLIFSARRKVKASPKSVGFLLWGPWIFVQKCYGIPFNSSWHISVWTKVVHTDHPQSHIASLVKKYCRALETSLFISTMPFPGLSQPATW